MGGGGLGGGETLQISVTVTCATAQLLSELNNEAVKLLAAYGATLELPCMVVEGHDKEALTVKLAASSCGPAAPTLR